jgi:hypothetical protein
MPRICALGLALVLVAPVGAQPKPDEYESKDGRYTIQFPGKPKESTQTAKTQAGALTVHTTTFATREGSVYLVSYTDFPAAMTRPENRDALFRGVREGLTGKDGKLVTEKDVMVAGAKGREVLVDKSKQQTRFRVTVKDSRLYQIAAVGTGPFVTGAEVTAFFDSFEFK